jgi:hypothetical protein
MKAKRRDQKDEDVAVCRGVSMRSLNAEGEELGEFEISRFQI